MPKSKSTKTNKTAKNRSRTWNTVLVIIIVLLVLSLGVVTVFARHYKKSVDDIRTIDSLLFQDIDKDPGYACGIFSGADAEELLGESVKRTVLNGPTPARWNGESDITLRKVDACYYESSSNSTLYAQVVFQTYTDSTTAKEEFSRSLPPVSEPMDKFGLIEGADAIVYDAGVHYILKGRQIIQIAASNGTPSDSEQISEQLVQLLEPSL